MAISISTVFKLLIDIFHQISFKINDHLSHFCNFKTIRKYMKVSFSSSSWVSTATLRTHPPCTEGAIRNFDKNKAPSRHRQKSSQIYEDPFHHMPFILWRLKNVQLTQVSHITHKSSLIKFRKNENLCTQSRSCNARDIILPMT